MTLLTQRPALAIIAVMTARTWRHGVLRVGSIPTMRWSECEAPVSGFIYGILFIYLFFDLQIAIYHSLTISY